MMKELLMVARGGVLSATKTLSDGNEHTLYFKARTAAEVVAFAGAEKRFPDTDEGDLAREKNRAKFIADSLCDEAGAALMTVDEAMLIPSTFKPELCGMVLTGSNKAGKA